MKPFQSRVVTERDELRSKIDLLAAFFDSTIYAELPRAEQSRMFNQLHHMNGYCEVLNERIEAF